MNIIVNLAVLQDSKLLDFLDEYCNIFEREDDCDVPLIQLSPNCTLVLLEPSSTITELPKGATHALVYSREGNSMPSRNLLDTLYALDIKVSFFKSLGGLKSVMCMSAHHDSYLSQLETCHERLLVKGLGISSFHAQYLLSTKPLKDILNDVFNKPS